MKRLKKLTIVMGWTLCLALPTTCSIAAIADPDLACSSEGSLRAVILGVWENSNDSIRIQLAWDTSVPLCNRVLLALLREDGTHFMPPRRLYSDDAEAPTFFIDLDTIHPLEHGRSYTLKLGVGVSADDFQDFAEPLNFHVTTVCDEKGVSQIRLIPGLSTDAVVISQKLESALATYDKLESAAAAYPDLRCEVESVQQEIEALAGGPGTPFCFWQATVEGNLETAQILEGEPGSLQEKGVEAGPGQCLSYLLDQRTGNPFDPGLLSLDDPLHAWKHRRARTKDLTELDFIRKAPCRDPWGNLFCTRKHHWAKMQDENKAAITLKTRCLDSWGDLNGASCPGRLDYSGYLRAFAISKTAAGSNSTTHEVIALQVKGQPEHVVEVVHPIGPDEDPNYQARCDDSHEPSPSGNESNHCEQIEIQAESPATALLRAEGTVELQAPAGTVAFGEVGNDYQIRIEGTSAATSAQPMCVGQAYLELMPPDFLTARGDGFETGTGGYSGPGTPPPPPGGLATTPSTGHPKSEVGGVKLNDWDD